MSGVPKRKVTCLDCASYHRNPHTITISCKYLRKVWHSSRFKHRHGSHFCRIKYTKQVSLPVDWLTATGELYLPNLPQQLSQMTDGVRSSATDIKDGANLAFICGFPSSGTDLLRNVMNAHPRIWIGGEFPFLPALAGEMAANVEASDISLAREKLLECDVYGNLRNPDVELESGSATPLADIYVKMMTSAQADWYGNKTPQNTENIEKLDSLFPASRFIIIVRDIRDVCLSWHRKWGKDMLLCAHKWTRRMALGQAATDELDASRYLYLTYENLLGQLEVEARRICEFLNVEFDPKILRFHEHVEEVVPGKLHFGEAIIPQNKKKWVDAIDVATVRRIEEIAWPALEQFDYDFAHAKSHRPITWYEIVRGYARDIVGTLFVGNRALKRNQLGARMTAIRVFLRKMSSRYRTDSS